jgi:hypothetical protein
MGPMCFVFCRLYYFSLKQPRQCLCPTCHLCIAGADLPQMMGEVSWDPKGRLLVFNPLWFNCLNSSLLNRYADLGTI